MMKDADSDVIARQYCAMALGNLAAEPDNHLEIVKSDGIEAFLAVLKTEDVDAGRYSAFGLANIGANANHRDRIVELGAVPHLISLACSEDVNAQRQALAGLRSICISPEFRAVVVREGIMDPLVLLSRVEDIVILREVASAINCLSSVEENKAEISDRAMSTVIGLMLSGDIIIERHAVCSAANLMEMIELHGKLSEERGVAPIVAIAASNDANSRGEACRCLANLSVNPDMHQIIIREGSLAPLVGALTQQELNCQRYASLCLANLSTTVAAQVKVIQMGAVKPLIDLGTNPMHQIEARRYAALALANLTATAANHMTIIEDGALQAFFSLCNSPDLMSQYYVGCALANLSCSIANHYIIVEQGGLQALITLVSSKDPDVHQQAAAALRGLAVSPINMMKIVQEGALLPLTLLLSSEDVEILREVVACFCNLSVSEENKLEIVKCGTIPAFISLSQSADMVVASMACATLANLAEYRANQDLITSEGAIRPTISVMRSKYIEVQREAGRLLANLCSSTSESTAGIIEAGGHSLLISYLLSQDTACQRVGSMGICNLCTQTRFRRVLMECGVVEPLCSLARSEDIELEIQRYAILAIANLASTTDVHHLFIAEGMLSLLIALSTANDAEVRQYAAYAVTKIAQNADVRKAVTEEGGLESVLYLARTEEPEIQQEVLPALCSLSFADSNKVAICRNGGLEPIVRAIREGSLAVVRLACCAIANLAEMVENYDRIYEMDAIPHLVNALTQPSEAVRSEAARALGNLAANIELADVILHEGALPHLFPLIRADEASTQRIAAFAMANLSSNIRNHTIMLNDGIFEILLVEITQALDPKSRSDFECTRYCLLVLTNFAVNPANHPLLMKDALPILAQYSKHRDIKCRQHAIFCIANLCSNKDNLEAIMESGSLRTIITYAFPSADTSANVQFQAIAALRGLSTHPLIRIQIVREGALEPLIICAKSNSIEVQREAAATLCNIALAEENKVILARGGALPALIALAMSGDRQRELHATAALANIAEMVEGRTQERMIDEGCLKPILLLAESDEAEIRREVSRAFALFASKRDSHTALVRIHAAVRMMTFLQDSDEACKRYGTLGIANLAVSRNTHQELFDVGAVGNLIQVSSSTDIATRRAVAFAMNNLASNPANHLACERIGIIRSIISLLKDHDKDTNLQATIAIRRLCESPRCRNQLVELNGISALLELGEFDVIEVKREVAAALRNLSLSEACKVAIVKAKGLRLIFDMMNHPDIEVCHQASGVIANLAEATENQGIMVDEGAIQHIKYIMRSKSIDIQREAARAMANISAEYTFAPAIVGAGALLALISTMSSPDFLCQRYAVMGVGNLACNPINQKKIVQEGGVPPLLSLAKFENGDLECQKYAAIALTNLSATKSNHALLVDTGIVSLMHQLMGHEEGAIKYTAVFALANLAANPNNHQLIINEKCVDPILAFLTQPTVQDADIQLRALSCIRGLSTDSNIRYDLLQQNILPPLLEFAKSDRLELQMEALACLCNLSLSGCVGENPDSFLESVTVKSLISFLCSADATYRLFGAVTIGNIASSIPLQKGLIQAGALVPLITVANAADLDTQRCIAYALCNLASDPSRRHDIVREGGLPSIISMACSDDVTDQLAALATLRGIAAQPENMSVMYQANLMEAIVLGGNSAEEEILYETASLLCALSIEESNRLKIIHENKLLDVLVRLLSPSSSDDVSSIRYLRPAIACVANLSEKLECHEILRQHQFHQICLPFVSHEDVATARESVRMLINISSQHFNQPPLIACGGIDALLAACNYDDAVVSRFGILGLSNLSAKHENWKHFKTDVGLKIISLAIGENKTWNSLDEYGNLTTNETTSLALKELNPSADTGLTIDVAITSKEEKFIRDHGYDRESRRYAVLALANLAGAESADTSISSILTASTCLEALHQALHSIDEDTRFHSSFALHKLSCHDDYQELLGSSNDIIHSLIELLSSEQSGFQDLKSLAYDTISQIIGSLRHIAMTASTRVIMVQRQLLQPLSQIASILLLNEHHYDLPAITVSEILREIAALTCLLSLTESIRSALVGSDILSPLLTLCSNSDVEIARQACGAIANLAESKRTHKRLAAVNGLTVSDGREGIMHSMIGTMRSNHLSVHREACRAVANMLSSTAFHRLFLEDQGLPSLHRLAKSSLDKETLLNCAIIYRKLSPVVGNHEQIVAKGNIPPLLHLASSSIAEVCHHAAAALRDLSSNPDYKTVITEQGGLARAIDLAQQSDNQLKVLAFGIIRHLSVNTRIKPIVLSEGGLIPIFLFIETLKPSELHLSNKEEIDLQIDNLRQCAAILALISEHSANQLFLIQNGILPRLLHTLNYNFYAFEDTASVVKSLLPDYEICAHVSRCLSALTSHPMNLVGVFGVIEFQAFQQLLTLANPSSTAAVIFQFYESTMRDCLVGLGNLAVEEKNQVLIASMGIIPVLNATLFSEEKAIQKFSLRCIARLVQNHSLHEVFLSLPLVERVLNLSLTREDVLIRKYALMLLCNFSTNEKTHAKMLEYGSLAVLPQHFRDPEETIVKYAVMTVCNLSLEGMIQLELSNLGAIELIITLLMEKTTNTYSSEIKRYLVMILSNMSTNRSCRMKIVQLQGLNPLISIIIGSTSASISVELLRACAFALYNLSTTSVNHVPMIQADVVPSLVILSNLMDNECHRYAVMTLSNLTANNETRPHATRKGGLQLAVHLLKDVDLDTKTYAAIALMNLATSSLSQEQIVIHGALSTLFRILESYENTSILSQALLVVNNLATNEINHSLMIQKKLLSILSDLYAHCDSTTCKEFVGFIFANLCGNDEYLSILGKEGAIPPLIMLSYSKNMNTLCLAISALRRLAQVEENWSRLFQAGILSSIAALADVHDIEVQREVSSSLTFLTQASSYRQEIAYKCIHTIEKLISILTENEISRNVLGSIANLAEESSTHESILQSPIILSRILAHFNQASSISPSSFSPEIQREASRAIANLLSSFRFHGSFFDLNIAQSLHQMAYLQEMTCQYNAAVAYRKLSPNIRSHAHFMMVDTFPALFHLLESSLKYQNMDSMTTLNIRRNAAHALVDICSNPDYKLTCSEQGGIEVFLALAKDEDIPLQSLAYNCLRHLSMIPELQFKIIMMQSKKILRRMIKSARHVDDNLHIQISGLLGNISENPSNHAPMIEDGIVTTLVNLAFSSLLEVSQDIARAFANLLANETLHMKMYKQGSLRALLKLSSSLDEICQRYSSMGIRFLSSNPDIRSMIINDGHIEAFISLAKNTHILEYRRTAASAFASFSLHEKNKILMIQQEGCMEILFQLAHDEDLMTKRDAVFILANLSESLEFQLDLIKFGIVPVLNQIAKNCVDTKIQRDLARAYASLTQYPELQLEVMKEDDESSFQSILVLSKSLDIPCQRYATLALCNLSSSIYKVRLVELGIIRPLIFLSRFPDAEIQRYSAMAMAGLALGGHGSNKQVLVAEGCIRPIIQLIDSNDISIKLPGILAMNAIILGREMNTKSIVMSEAGLPSILSILRDPLAYNLDIIVCVVYAIGSLAEHYDVLVKLVDLNAIQLTVDAYYVLAAANAKALESSSISIMDLSRAIGYFLASICCYVPYHGILYHQHAFQLIIDMASIDDIECQEYAAFCLAHLSSNRDYQIIIVELGAVRPLVTMLSSDSEQKHYAGLALLKLADNFANHTMIAEAGGIQALLRLGRTRGVDEQIQYKAALSVGQLASNALQLLPPSSSEKFSKSIIGHGAKMLQKIHQAERDTATANARVRTPPLLAPITGPKTGADIVDSFFQQTHHVPNQEDRLQRPLFNGGKLDPIRREFKAESSKETKML
jgi:hypothetical protein